VATTGALAQLLQGHRAAGLEAFRGAVVEGTLPLRESVLNGAIQQTVLKSGSSLRDLRLSLPGGSRIVVDLTAAVLLFTKRVQLVLEIEPLVDFQQNPVLRMRIVSSSLGLIGGLLAEIVGSAFKHFPEGVSITNQVITVDLGAMLRQNKLGDLAPLVKTLGFRGEPGILYVDFQLAVD
jgi:hypothetical protein